MEAELIECLGEALHSLSDSLRKLDTLADDEAHQRYEAVVAAFTALTRPSPEPSDDEAERAGFGGYPELADELEATGDTLCEHGAIAIRHLLLSTLRPSPDSASIIDPQPEIVGDPVCKIVSYNQAHEDAVEMGYPSITEALEHLDELRAERASIRAEATLEGVWQQARENHANHSDTGSREQDIRFFALGLSGEAGEVANFVKKRWRDGEGHDDDLRKECADVFAYNIMLADALGMSPQDLLDMVAFKQRVFVEKMAARALANKETGDA